MLGNKQMDIIMFTYNIRVVLRGKPTSVSVEFTLGNEAVTLSLGEDGRNSISFPKNSVLHPVSITIGLLTPKYGDFEDGVIPVSPIMRCMPSGIKFEAPVTISLSTWIAAKKSREELKLQILSRENEGADWKVEQTINHKNLKSVKYQINHFCDDVVVVSDSAEANRAVYEYCNLLFVPLTPETHGANQNVVSWFVPDDECIITTTKREAARDGLKLFPGGRRPLRLAMGQTLRISTEVDEQEQNREQFEIR